MAPFPITAQSSALSASERNGGQQIAFAPSRPGFASSDCGKVRYCVHVSAKILVEDHPGTTAQTVRFWNLRRLRVAKNISQDELALSSDVERAYVGHLERGTKNPTIDTLAKLAAALDSEIIELFREMPQNAGPLPPLKGGRRKS